MDGEFVVCNIADWLRHYLPSFNPDEDIKDIRKELVAKNILERDLTASQQAIGEGSAEGNARGRTGSAEAEDQGNERESYEASDGDGANDGNGACSDDRVSDDDGASGDDGASDDDTESAVSFPDHEDKDYHDEKGDNDVQKGKQTKEKGEQPDQPRRSARLDLRRPGANEVPEKQGPVDDGTNVPYRWVKYP